jgi:hypothetical protein
MMELREIVVKLLGICIVLALVGASLPSAAQATAAHYQLDIPREPLDSALKDFARQTGLQIARFTDDVNGSAAVGPVAGSLTSEEALQTLLSESELTYRILNDRTIAVVGKQTAPSTGGAAPVQSSTDGRVPAKSPDDGAAQDDQKAKGSFWDRFRLAQGLHERPAVLLRTAPEAVNPLTLVTVPTASLPPYPAAVRARCRYRCHTSDLTHVSCGPPIPPLSGAWISRHHRSQARSIWAALIASMLAASAAFK